MSDDKSESGGDSGGDSGTLDGRVLDELFAVIESRKGGDPDLS